MIGAKDKASLPWVIVMKTVNKLLSSGEDKAVAILLLLSLPPLIWRGGWLRKLRRYR